MMHEADPRSVLDAAEQAAGAGDYASAERLLREALAQQEASLGAEHPDVANTLNNLAVVCERQEKVAEAEQGYRRAHAIAVTSLPPGHPFIATSLRNLVEFCEARGIPLWTPPAARQPAEAATHAPPVSASESWASAGIRVPRHLPAAGVIVVVVAVAALLVAAPWQAPERETETPSAESHGPPPSPALPPTSPAAPAGTTPVSPATGAEPAETRESGAPAAGGAPPAPVPAQPSLGLAVASAQVCSNLERRGSPDWLCTPVRGSTPPGVLTFYTRIQTASDLTVEHRWYHDERLYQAMRLDVGANPGRGFRTFSRTTIGPERTGAWRVELRVPDGTVLHEARFVVR
jgi:hypothetical protein